MTEENITLNVEETEANKKEEAKRIADKKAADKKAADEVELAAQLLEVVKLNAITNKLWKDGEKTNFENMSHTEAGVLKHEIKKRAEVHQGFMTSLTRNSNKIIRQNAPAVQQKPVAKLSTRQTMFNSGMMFGRR